MLIDLHNHTRISSECSVLSPEELIETARAKGLDAICVTDHLTIDGATVARDVGERLGFPVFRGIEARADVGDMLVFGFYEDIPEFIPLADLCAQVHRAGGVVFAAHPYHPCGGWNLYRSMRMRGMDLDAHWDKIGGLRELNGVEVINGQLDRSTNARARVLASRLGVSGIGGSDAHAVHMVARAATRFHSPVHTERDFVQALKKGRFEAVWLRE